MITEGGGVVKDFYWDMCIESEMHFNAKSEINCRSYSWLPSPSSYPRPCTRIRCSTVDNEHNVPMPSIDM